MVGNHREYEAMAACEGDFWWYRNLHLRVLHTIVQRYGQDKNLKIFDAGCGTGGLMFFLQNNGYQQIRGLDISEDAIFFCKQKGLTVERENILNIGNLVEQGTLDVLVSNDNLYFFDDQHFVLQEYAKTLKPGGICIMNLPSLQCFSGTHDRAVGIEKRFDLPSFKRLVSTTDFKIERNMYWPFFLSPLIWATRMGQRLFADSDHVVSDVKMPPTMINQMLYSLTRSELHLPFDGFFGSSLFVVLSKKK
ncbi:MAG: class I SAM-dependent methyltransferase [Cytophagales bacterium]|nr:class I SAM-dependent methyltransferase [Cytophagales bacterium]